MKELNVNNEKLLYYEKLSCFDNSYNFVEKENGLDEKAVVDISKYSKNGQEIIEISVGDGYDRGFAVLTTSKAKELLNILSDAIKTTELELENEMDSMDYEY